jgi:hypothetical protein
MIASVVIYYYDSSHVKVTTAARLSYRECSRLAAPSCIYLHDTWDAKKSQIGVTNIPIKLDHEYYASDTAIARARELAVRFSPRKEDLQEC